ELVLSYKQSFFSFEFVALDYAQSTKNQYAFMMEGFDDKWIHVGNRRYASYTNLDPGEYIFRVKASNNNGVWNEEGASIRIIITPPFWRTNIFYILCLLFVIMVVFGYIKWRERKLNEEKKILEDQVTMRTKELTEANSEIVQKNHEITDSINYAKRIQQAILPDKNEIYSILPHSFVLYKPKDIVSGDFYFFKAPPDLPKREASQGTRQTDSTMDRNPSPWGKLGGVFFIAAADCTGHGVPGAFMSMIGSEKLHDAVQQSKIPGEILMLINKGIKTTLHQSQNDNSTRDGMDIAFCTIDLQNNKVLYSGANRPFLLIRKDSSEIEEIKATKNAIGGFTENNQSFETHEIQLKPGDTFYIFTDGYADQFGGEKGKKFTTKKFKKLLVEIQNKSMQEQEKLLSNVMDAWSLNAEQVDDILIIGIRI
ncbi:MAG: SpoIIE family protein phosphatase, partial [Bacteroidetes bacterium]|nr:SpoIIE family protein phosphatase [Bacteroidota bacterium]